MLNMNELLAFAVENKASDIHFAAGIPPKLRINGKLVGLEMDPLMPADVAELLGSAMNDKQRKVLKERGEVDYSYAHPECGRFRVNVFMDRGNMAAAFRRVDTIIPRPDQLGIPNAVVELYKRRRGLVLVTGPTGSGKSTTLASIINKANENRTDHIITLEDPIEYVHKHKKSIVNQREVGMDTLSYNNALRAALREDPDIILVGEMRDYETISAALTAAETGHLVMSTLHTTGAAQTIDRIIDACPAGMQNQVRTQLASVLNGVITQCLIPNARGNGRVVATEILVGTDAVCNQIRENKCHQLGSLMQSGSSVGMHTLNGDLSRLVQNGMINRQMAYKYSNDVAELDQYL